MSAFMSRGRKSRLARRVRPELQGLEGRALLSTVHAAAAPPVVPVPAAFFAYEKVTITGDVDRSGHYVDFLEVGSSPDWGASGLFKYVDLTVRGVPTRFYTIQTTDRTGTSISSVAVPQAYSSPGAPTGLILQSRHYSPLYASPPGHSPPQGPVLGAPAFDLTKALPAPYNTITGTLIPGTNHYSSFSMGGSKPSKGTTLILGYHTGTPYGVNVYFWTVYIHSPVLGNIGYQEVDPSPYYSAGLPSGVASYYQRYQGYL